MINAIIQEIETSQLRKNIPAFRPGDTVRVSVRIVEGDKERVQDYEGVVIARRGSSVRETFTVRRVSFGVGMERTFQVNSPRIEEIKIVRRGKVRRAKLYYLRNLRGKKARLVERKGIDLTVLSANSRTAEAAEAASAAKASESAPEQESAPATT